jgi:hypothetical protein
MHILYCLCTVPTSYIIRYHLLLNHAADNFGFNFYTHKFYLILIFLTSTSCFQPRPYTTRRLVTLQTPARSQPISDNCIQFYIVIIIVKHVESQNVHTTALYLLYLTLKIPQGLLDDGPYIPKKR